MKRLFLISFLGFLLILGTTSQIMAQNTVQQDQETFIIVFDEAHYQYFTYDMMRTAFETLNTSLDTNAMDVTVDIIIQKESFNATNIQGADLVVVTNPGLDENGDLPEIASSETDALESLINLGSSVLWMSNPLAHNQNVTGHARPLNDLIYFEFGVDVASGVGDQDNTTVIKDDLNFINNNSYVVMDSTNFNDQTLVTEYIDFASYEDDSLVVYSTYVKERSGLPGDISANSSQTAYAINKEFNYEPITDTPRWIYGEDFTSEDRGRGMLIGSTVMFSEMMFDDTNKWVDQRNNLELFQNMIAWLLELTPIPESLAIVTEPFSFFVNFNVMFGIALTGIVAAFVIFRYARQGRLSLGDMSKFRREKSKRKQSPSSSSTKTDKSKSKKKSSKRKRI